jgi:hypothetical protein
VARQSVPAGGPPGEIVEEWALVRADRFVDGLPVYGPGSVAVAELRGGAVSGHMIRWDRAGEPTSRPTRALSRLLLSQELARNFDEGSEDIRAVGTELVYFDDRTRLYPAYRTSVEVDHHDSAPPDRVDLFIPAVKPDALVNVDAATSGPHCEEVAPVKGSGLVVDRYVINDEPEWASNADLFHRQLAADTDFGARNFCLLEPRMLKAEQASYIDSATVALLETHGIPRHVKTFRYNKGEYWQDLADVGGLGDADPALRLLILHSCSVVCTTDEDADWFKVWFQVFQGLHTVLGYHTKVSYRDGVSAAFASHLRDDEPMIRGWMAEIVASSTYQDTTHYGLGAAVTVCGQGDARPSQLARMSSPACLAAYWLRD